MDDAIFIRIPWWFPPHNAFWFDEIGANDVSVNTGNITLIDYQLPLATRGVVRWFGQEVSNTGKKSAVTWNIQINGSPDKVYGSVVGIISTIEAPTETLIKIPKGGNIKLIVSSSDLENISVIGRFKGWHWIGEQ